MTSFLNNVCTVCFTKTLRKNGGNVNMLLGGKGS